MYTWARTAQSRGESDVLTEEAGFSSVGGYVGNCPVKGEQKLFAEMKTAGAPPEILISWVWRVAQALVF